MSETEHDRQRLADLIWQALRAADVGGEEQSGAKGSPELQSFGVEVGSLRRKQELSLAEAARRSGLSELDWLVIELGRASIDQVSQSLPAVGQALGGQYQHLSSLLAKLVFEA